ncbi:MAG: hypothetical protein VBE63_30620, partial [Lamprobacter sp.]|nr:hypothetical protein [Lamprobacter sp.]
QGRLEFLTPLRLKQGPLRVVVEVPDEAIDEAGQLEGGRFDTASAVTPDAEAFRQAGAPTLTVIRQILGPMSRARPVASPAEDKATLTEALADKYSR